MKIELKHLIDAYKYQDEIIGRCDSWRIAKISDDIVYLSNGLHENQVLVYDFEINYKIVKHPLSDLTKEIEVNGEKFVPLKKMGYNVSWYGWDFYKINILEQKYSDIQKLLEWHFDIYGLIEKGLAIDINTLKK